MIALPTSQPEAHLAPAPQEVATNPFTSPESDPFSTFAADVDTASYDLYRSSLLNAGQLPPAESVRVEEFVNYFDYEYAFPSEEDAAPFRIDLAATPDHFDTPRTILRVGIQAEPPSAFEKKPTNIAFLIDTSGSMMNEQKLELAKILVKETLDVLEPEDRVSVVTYGPDTHVVVESTTADNRALIEPAVDALFASGGTDGASGIGMAYDQVRKNFIEGGINHVVLCTDGDFNVGPSTTAELVLLIEDERRSGVTLTAVGFGTAPNDEMMEELSNRGNGVYGIIASAQHAAEYARERLLSSLQLIAKDLKIQVEFNPQHVHAYRLIGYENRAIADDDFVDDTVDAGEVGAGHRVTAIYELALTEEQLPEGANVTVGETSELEREIAADDLVLVKVRYKDVDATSTDEAYAVDQALAVSEIGEADLDLEWASAVATFAELLRGSPMAQMSQLDQVQATIERQLDRDDDRTEFVELFFTARPLLEARQGVSRR
jgi:Ca-activated chloride channel family protein